MPSMISESSLVYALSFKRNYRQPYTVFHPLYDSYLYVKCIAFLKFKALIFCGCLFFHYNPFVNVK